MAGDECCEILRKCLQPLIDLIFPRRNDENANYVPVPEAEYAPNVEQDPLLSEALAKNYQAIVDNAAKEFLQAAKPTKPRSNSGVSSVPSEQLALIRQRLVTAVVDPALAASPPSAVIIPITQPTATATAEEQAPPPGEDSILTSETDKTAAADESSSNNNNDDKTGNNGSKKTKKSKKTKQATNNSG